MGCRTSQSNGAGFRSVFRHRANPGGRPVLRQSPRDLDHPPVAVRHLAKLALHAPDRWRQVPVLEGRAIPEGTGLASQDRNVVQRGRRWPCRAQRLGRAAPRSCRPARTRPARHRHVSRQVGQRPGRPRSSGFCRTGRGMSSRPRLARHGSRRTDRSRAQDSCARPGAHPRSFDPEAPSADWLWPRQRSDP